MIARFWSSSSIFRTGFRAVKAVERRILSMRLPPCPRNGLSGPRAGSTRTSCTDRAQGSYSSIFRVLRLRNTTRCVGCIHAGIPRIEHERRSGGQEKTRRHQRPVSQSCVVKRVPHPVPYVHAIHATYGPCFASPRR